MAKLENKTKAQLIEIIMRKDDVENELRKEINQLKQEYDTLKADYEDTCDSATENNQQNADEYEKLLGDYNTLKKSYNNAIKDCQGTSKVAEARAEKIISLGKELVECKKVRDTWVVTAVVAVLIACVICVL